MSRFRVAWIRNTIRKATTLVPVLITNCHVSLKPKTGPVTAHTAPARRKVAGGPEIREVATARRANQPPLDCEVDEELPLYWDDDHLNLRGDLLLKPLFGAVIEEISSDQRARVDH